MLIPWKTLIVFIIIESVTTIPRKGSKTAIGTQFETDIVLVIEN